ncbi:hypothetical protein Scep_029589 [Stephania cephalantha]|uniref:Uncharacterized protein n=1 Tax=Stephania cephalantha TaxID=152367 RepID=A0AAP0E198_9MAGN
MRAAQTAPNSISQNPSSIVDLPSPHQDPSFPTISRRRSTRLVSKMHVGRPKSAVAIRHSSAAEEALGPRTRTPTPTPPSSRVLRSLPESSPAPTTTIT